MNSQQESTKNLTESAGFVGLTWRTPTKTITFFSVYDCSGMRQGSKHKVIDLVYLHCNFKMGLITKNTSQCIIQELQAAGAVF